ncbi:hypothetical protein G5B37_14650 [Rasiella rasia]|uniref:Uncharacterized protein n=1 Tax=Rasiella rasia TaxID=2744027 RepID=A0A6G6GQC2_9FLAO|nr:hypothetical protein [Rasiella rasia]QIE60749.1 hypothetical protein G5B37_14650 [Rasiella rasia]
MKQEKKYTTGFTTPDHYFDDLEERILNSVLEDTLPKEAGFKVPENYFNRVEEKLVAQIPAISEETDAKVIPLYKSRIFIVSASVAACVAFIVSIINFSSETSITLNDVNTETIASYIDEGNLDFSEQEIALLLQDEDVSALAVPSEDISTENLTDYLLNNIDDPSLYLE